MKHQITDYLKDAFGLEDADAAELFDSYVQTVKENLAKLADDVKRNDLKGAAAAAHTIKGCALNCGHTEMAEAAKAAEFAAKADDINAVSKNVEKIGALAAKLAV